MPLLFLLELSVVPQVIPVHDESKRIRILVFDTPVCSFEALLFSENLEDLLQSPAAFAVYFVETCAFSQRENCDFGSHV